MTVSVKLGFVPSYRFRWTEWTEKMRSDSLAALGRIPGAEVVAPTEAVPHGAVQEMDQAELVAVQFDREKIDALVICPLDFGDERSACKIAEKLGVPILLYATKEPPAIEDAGMGRVSDSYCGNLSIAAGLHRRKLPFHFAGIFFPDEADFRAGAEAFVRAVSVAKGLRNARIGQIGVRPAAFETVAYDEVAMARKFGQNVIHANLDDIVDRAKNIGDNDPRVQAVLEDIARTVKCITVAKDYLMQAAKLETAMVEFSERNRLSALAMQCWPSIQREMGISLCALFGRLTQHEMLTACETDILGAISMLIQHRAALGQTLPHFIDWTIQHRENPNRLLAWHCGNAPVCLARSANEIALRSRMDMAGSLPVLPGDAQAGLYQFQIKDGPVTFCRLAEYDGEWKMLIASGEIVPSDETLAGTWAWVQVDDHARLYRTLVEEGFIHHASMIHGDQAPALLLACKLMGIQPVKVA
ncbi:MAG: hypothetical protein IT210_12415 [Armatimonadetes bacterium]|nr:hypothetical protein [Armatimonadota bacterium]